MLASRRLPGIRIDTLPPQAAQALPRMDVAVLVGFAATGPLHLPVAVESVGQYAAVFGADAALAWDAERGERVLAYLGSAVRAFFANGGRRCWVIRVARQAAAESLWRGIPLSTAAALPDVARANRFAIPGVLACAGGATSISAALAQARCEGCWSDDVRVSSALTQRSLRVDSLIALDALPAQHLLLRTRFGLRAGDLLMFGDPAGTCAYAVATLVAPAPSPAASGAVDATLTVCAAFERVVAEAPGSPPAGEAGSLEIAGWVSSAAAVWSAPTTITPEQPLPSTVQTGHWARWQGADAAVWLRIGEVRRLGTSTADPTLVDALLVGDAWRELPAVLPAALAGVLRAQVLALDLRAQNGPDTFTLSGLGLTPGLAAGWWEQLTDQVYYAPDQTAQPGAAVLATARLPLACEDGAPPLAWIPLGVEPVFSAATTALPQAAAPLQRDGLARFDAELFLDPELGSTSVNSLPGLAETVRTMRDEARSLFGIHAALAIGEQGLFGEATLLAVPDAVHAGWVWRGATVPPAGTSPALPVPDAWRRHRGACADSSSSADSTVDTAPLQAPDFSAFIDCSVRVQRAPVLAGPVGALPPGPYRLDWDDAEPGAEYVLLAAASADASDAAEVYRGPATFFEGFTRRDGITYFQVHAERGDQRSAASNIVAVVLRSSDFEQVPAAAIAEAFEQQWLRVHRAALRLAAATGELFAVLAMPRHFRTDQALRYAARLRAVQGSGIAGGADAQALSFGEARALSYGALHHPWLLTSAGPPLAGTVALRALPPDGAALGAIASRAALRGAWVAPANEPLRDVIGTTLQPDGAQWQALQDAQINLMRADPRGVMVMSADTLALDPELRPINVRRLLTLLRRLALRRGTSYVFEPNGPVLRRAVQRGFGELLTNLFRRGAFAGARPEQAFQVIVDDTVNTTADVDAGRFVVELRVAPSLPMRFIAVRLAQSGERLTVAEEL